MVGSALSICQASVYHGGRSRRGHRYTTAEGHMRRASQASMPVRLESRSARTPQRESARWAPVGFAYASTAPVAATSRTRRASGNLRGRNASR